MVLGGNGNSLRDSNCNNNNNNYISSSNSIPMMMISSNHNINNLNNNAPINNGMRLLESKPKWIKVLVKARAFVAAANNKQLFFEMFLKLLLPYLQPAEILKMLQLSSQFVHPNFKHAVHARLEQLITSDNAVSYRSLYVYAMKMEYNLQFIKDEFQFLASRPNCYEELINNDVIRTFTNSDFFKPKKNQERLVSILKSASLKHPSKGYTQGMNYIAAVISTFLLPEETFWTLHRLMNSFELSLLYNDELANLAPFTFLVSCFIKHYMPNLFNHMKINNVMYDIVLQRWLLTFFAKDLEISLIIKILNLFVFKGLKSLFRAILSLLCLHTKKILSLKKQEDIYEFLQETMSDHPISHSSFLKEMNKFKVTRRLIKEGLRKFKRQKTTQTSQLFDLIRTQHHSLEWFDVCGSGSNSSGGNSNSSPNKSSNHSSKKSNKTRQKRSYQSSYVSNYRDRTTGSFDAPPLNQQQAYQQYQLQLQQQQSQQKQFNQQMSLQQQPLKLSQQQQAPFGSHSALLLKQSQIPFKREWSVSQDQQSFSKKSSNPLTGNAAPTQLILQISHLKNISQLASNHKNNNNNTSINSNRANQPQPAQISQTNSNQQATIIRNTPLPCIPEGLDSQEAAKTLETGASDSQMLRSACESEEERANLPLESQLNHQSFKDFRSQQFPQLHQAYASTSQPSTTQAFQQQQQTTQQQIHQLAKNFQSQTSTAAQSSTTSTVLSNPNQQLTSLFQPSPLPLFTLTSSQQQQQQQQISQLSSSLQLQATITQNQQQQQQQLLQQQQIQEPNQRNSAVAATTIVGNAKQPMQSDGSYAEFQQRISSAPRAGKSFTICMNPTGRFFKDKQQQQQLQMQANRLSMDEKRRFGFPETAASQSNHNNNVLEKESQQVATSCASQTASTNYPNQQQQTQQSNQQIKVPTTTSTTAQQTATNNPSNIQYPSQLASSSSLRQLNAITSSSNNNNTNVQQQIEILRETYRSISHHQPGSAVHPTNSQSFLMQYHSSSILNRFEQQASGLAQQATGSAAGTTSMNNQTNNERAYPSFSMHLPSTQQTPDLNVGQLKAQTQSNQQQQGVSQINYDSTQQQHPSRTSIGQTAQISKKPGGISSKEEGEQSTVLNQNAAPVALSPFAKANSPAPQQNQFQPPPCPSWRFEPSRESTTALAGYAKSNSNNNSFNNINNPNMRAATPVEKEAAKDSSINSNNQTIHTPQQQQQQHQQITPHQQHHIIQHQLQQQQQPQQQQQQQMHYQQQPNLTLKPNFEALKQPGFKCNSAIPFKSSNSGGSSSQDSWQHLQQQYLTRNNPQLQSQQQQQQQQYQISQGQQPQQQQQQYLQQQQQSQLQQQQQQQQLPPSYSTPRPKPSGSTSSASTNSQTNTNNGISSILFSNNNTNSSNNVTSATASSKSAINTGTPFIDNSNSNKQQYMNQSNSNSNSVNNSAHSSSNTNRINIQQQQSQITTTNLKFPEKQPLQPSKQPIQINSTTYQMQQQQHQHLQQQQQQHQLNSQQQQQQQLQPHARQVHQFPLKQQQLNLPYNNNNSSNSSSSGIPGAHQQSNSQNFFESPLRDTKLQASENNLPKSFIRTQQPSSSSSSSSSSSMPTNSAQIGPTAATQINNTIQLQQQSGIATTTTAAATASQSTAVGGGTSSSSIHPQTTKQVGIHLLQPNFFHGSSKQKIQPSSQQSQQQILLQQSQQQQQQQQQHLQLHHHQLHSFQQQQQQLQQPNQSQSIGMVSNNGSSGGSSSFNGGGVGGQDSFHQSILMNQQQFAQIVQQQLLQQQATATTAAGGVQGQAIAANASVSISAGFSTGEEGDICNINNTTTTTNNKINSKLQDNYMTGSKHTKNSSVHAPHHTNAKFTGFTIN